MFRPYFKNFNRRDQRKPQNRTNEQIRVPQVRLLDENGAQVGVVSTSEALSMARAKGLDLIEISPKANPPVARILNFDKFRYQQMKIDKKKRSQATRVETKGVRLTPRIGDHDLEFKAKQATKFLEDDNKVEIQLFMRGREWIHQDLARGIMQTFVQKISTPVKIEMPPTKQGNNILMILIPSKKRKVE